MSSKKVNSFDQLSELLANRKVVLSAVQNKIKKVVHEKDIVDKPIKTTQVDSKVEAGREFA